MAVAEPPRVGYVVKRYPRYSETFIVSELLAHQSAGLDVEIFSLYPPNDAHFQNVIAEVRAPVTYLPAEGVRCADFWGALADAGAELPGLWPAIAEARVEDARCVYQSVVLARALRTRGITHLHAHFATDATTVARLAARIARVPYTCTVHAKDIFHESVRPADLCRKLADAAAVITVSDYNVAYLRDRFGAAAARVRRVYNGLDLQRFAYDAPDDRPPCVVAVGRLIQKKGFGDLVDACAILAERGLRFECRIVGTGPLEGALRAKIERAGLASRVRLLGPRPQADVIGHIRAAAAFAAPCIVGDDGNRDGLPTVLLEAMALGTPCVSTDVTGIPEVVRDGETGLLVRQGNPAALATALERLLVDVALRVRLATSARRLNEAEFDIQRNAAVVRQAFSHAAALRHRVRAVVGTSTQI